MRKSKLVKGLIILSVLAVAVTLSQAAIITETFDTDSTDMPTDYPSYVYHPNSTYMSVSSGVLYVQDRSDNQEVMVEKTTMFIGNTGVSGAITLDVDLGCEPASGGIGRISTGVMLGDLSGSFLLFRYHPLSW